MAAAGFLPSRVAAGVTATFVTALVSMDCMNEFHHVVGIVQGGVPPYGVKDTLVVNGKNGWDIDHCSIPPPLLGAPANGNRKSISLSESEHQPSARGTNSPVFRSQETFRTVILLRLILCGS